MKEWAGRVHFSEVASNAVDFFAIGAMTPGEVIQARQRRHKIGNTEGDGEPNMKVHCYDTAEELGMAAAKQAAARMQAVAAQQQWIPVVFATGASQLATLRGLTAIPDLPWERVIGFHMDEYLGISAEHPASFRHYLRKELVERVPLREFHEIDGNASDADQFCAYYTDLLRRFPAQLCLLGIGENGHLAFNDPAEADFGDSRDMKIVTLDRECRQQQVNEEWFGSLEEVPKQALTLTIPALMRIPELIASVPGRRKCGAVERTLGEEISTHCPATILRTHVNAHVYLDRDSAAGVEFSC